MRRKTARVHTRLVLERLEDRCLLSDVLVEAGSTWNYLDNGSDQGTAWRANDFNDASWKSGAAQLGYGDGDEKTVVGYGPNSNNKYITTYFRRAFDVADASIYARLDLGLVRDDGAVVYLNGIGVFRSNMPKGTITYTTRAPSGVSGADESKFFPATVSPSVLVSGTNVLAVEIHQQSASSADISFDLELTGVTQVVNVAASDASAAEPGTDTGTFTFARLGSTSADLTVNYTLSGTASNGDDYVSLPNSVTIPAGADSTTLTVTPIDDTLAEPTETVILTLSDGGPAYSVGTASSATVTIADDDTEPVTLLPAGATWKYLDDGSDQGTAWQASTFDDSSWASGAAKLGYGDGDEQTVVSYGPDSNSKYITTYFRRSFDLEDASVLVGSTLKLMRDDGAVVYLNGTEVFRSNLPSRTITYKTTASSNVAGADESTYYQALVDAGLLVTGTNVLAVEIHQVSASSDDVGFDLELDGSIPIVPVVSITGTNGTAAEGAAINLGSTVSDPRSDSGFTYAWGVTKDGSAYDSGSDANFSFTPDDNATYVVTLSVTDSNGATGTDSKTITVTNVAPTITITGAPDSSPEGTAISLGNSVTDPSSADSNAGFSYAWSVTKDGNAYASGSDAGFSFTPDHTGTYVATLTVTDKDAAEGTDSKTITVPYPVRGIYDRDDSSTGFDDEAAIGFNYIDTGPYLDQLNALADRGLKGMVWLGGYDNSTCEFNESDDWVASHVGAIAGNSGVGAYFIDDEPDAHLCPSAPDQIKARSDLVHSLDPDKPTLIVTYHVKQLRLFAGTVDIIGLNHYPISYKDGANYSIIDEEVAEADRLGIRYWGVVQAHGDDPNSSKAWYRQPTTDELDQEFVYWRASHMEGYLVFAWHWPDSDSTLWLANHPELQDQLKVENTKAHIPTASLVAPGSTWKYLDNGSDQGTAWQANSFDDSGWSSGAGQLGYGDGDETTVVNYGPSATNKYITTYFRLSFEVTNPSEYGALMVRLLRDDGAVVYLNGTEVFRSNMPTDTITFTTLASSSVSGANESRFYPTILDSSYLLSGTNVLAVEIHQASSGSADISFDLGLLGLL